MLTRHARLSRQLDRLASHLTLTSVDVGGAKAVAEAHLRTTHPSARLHVFGAELARLRLPRGDLDLMIEQPDASPRALLSALHATLKSAPHAAVARLSYRDRGPRRLPRLSWLDVQSGVTVDVAANVPRSLSSTAEVVRESAALPALRPVVLALKAHLWTHDLQEHATGGLGGYQLAAIAARFIRERAADLEDSGAVLLGLMGHLSDTRVLDRELRRLAPRRRDAEHDGGVDAVDAADAMVAADAASIKSEDRASRMDLTSRRRAMCSILRLNRSRMLHAADAPSRAASAAGDEVGGRGAARDGTAMPLALLLPQWSEELNKAGMWRCIKKWEDMRRIRISQFERMEVQGRALSASAPSVADPLWSGGGGGVIIR